MSNVQWRSPRAAACPSVVDATPPRYPHVQGGSVTSQTARSAVQLGEGLGDEQLLGVEDGATTAAPKGSKP